MRSKIMGLLAVAASLGFVQAASAADMPAKMPVKAAPIVAAPYNWTGLYVGVQGGYGWGRSDETFLLAPNTAASNFSQAYDTNGGVAGGVLGYNWQRGMLVFGAEGDISWSGIKGTSAIINVGPPNLADTYDTSLVWYGSARGKLGIAQDRWLAYITGGLAFGELKHNYNPGLNVPNCGSVGATCSNNVTRAGWTLGAGLEYALMNNWSVKVEYNYIDLGSSAIQYSAAPAANRSTWKDTFSVAKIGINYLFH